VAELSHLAGTIKIVFASLIVRAKVVAAVSSISAIKAKRRVKLTKTVPLVHSVPRKPAALTLTYASLSAERPANDIDLVIVVEASHNHDHQLPTVLTD
jgi:hypothetical protein